MKESLRYLTYGVHPLILLLLLFGVFFWVFGTLSKGYWLLDVLLVIVVLIAVFWDPFLHASLLLGNAGHHVWFILAPVHDLLQGKHLLVDTSSQYGALLIQMLAFLFWVGVPFTFASFTVFLMILSIMYHGVLFWMLRMIYDDRFLAFLGLLLVLSMGFLRLAQSNFPGEPYVHPNSLKLRFLFDLPILALLTCHARRGNRILPFFAAVLVGIAPLYNIEIGLSLLFAFLAYVSVHACCRQHWKQMFRTPLLLLLVLLASAATTFGLFTWWTYARSGFLPDFSPLSFYPRIYYSGFGSLPMPIFGAWTLILFLYVATLLFVVKKLLCDGGDVWTALRASWAIYGLMIFHYYISRSHIGNLSAVTMPVVVLGLWFLKDLRSWFQQSIRFSWNTSSVAAGVVLLTVIGWMSVELTAGYSSLKNLLLKRYASPLLSWKVDAYAKEHPSGWTWGFPLSEEAYERTAKSLRKLVPEPERPIILSQQDFFHYWVLRSTNALVLAHQQKLILKSEVRDLERQIAERSPRYLFLDAPEAFVEDIPPCSICDELKPFIDARYVFVRNIGLLAVYERRSS